MSEERKSKVLTKQQLEAAAVDLRPLITNHAVLRYVQRILGVALGEQGDMSDDEWLERHCEAAGKNPSDIRVEIMSPALTTAIIMGQSRVGTPRFRAIIKPDESVVTIMHPFSKLAKHADRSLSRLRRRSVKEDAL